VVDRDGPVLVTAGAVVTGAPDAGAEGLVALARRALDAAPAGPPFAGILLAGALPAARAGEEELPAAVARVTGHPPLLAGDPGTAAVLGAASLGWAVATAGPAPEAAAAPPSAAGGRPAPPKAPELPGDRRSRRPPWWALALGVLVLGVVAAGLLVRHERTQPSPYTHVCPNGVAVAYSEECALETSSP
jgi:hypothetical protein